MAEPDSEKAGLDYKQVLTWIIALAFGGFGGAVFNQWYTNRSTIVQYSINKTVLGTDQMTVVPGFRVQVGETSVQSLYLYTLRLEYASGPELDGARIGIELKPGVKLVGNTVPDKPGEAFEFKCNAFERRTNSTGTVCDVRRFGKNVGAYTVSFATDGAAEVTVSLDAKNSVIERASAVNQESSLLLRLFQILAFAFFGGAVGQLVWLYFERRISAQRLASVNAKLIEVESLSEVLTRSLAESKRYLEENRGKLAELTERETNLLKRVDRLEENP